MGQTLSTREEALRAERETFKTALQEGKRLDSGFIERFNKFIKECPKALGWKDENGETLNMFVFCYLGGALERRDRLEDFKDFVTPQTLKVFRMQNEYGWTLLHIACRFNPTALDVISFVLEQCPESAQILNSWKQTPLHLACIYGASLPVIERLVDECPKTVRARDFQGQTPLHDHFNSVRASLEVTRFLAMKELVVCLAQDEDGDLPLDVARCSCRKDKKVKSIEFLTSVTNATAEVVMGCDSEDEDEEDDDIDITSIPLHHLGDNDVSCRKSFANFRKDAAEKAATLKLSITKDQIIPLLQRYAVQSKIVERVRQATKMHLIIQPTKGAGGLNRATPKSSFAAAARTSRNRVY